MRRIGLLGKAVGMWCRSMGAQGRDRPRRRHVARDSRYEHKECLDVCELFLGVCQRSLELADVVFVFPPFRAPICCTSTGSMLGESPLTRLVT